PFPYPPLFRSSARLEGLPLGDGISRQDRGVVPAGSLEGARDDVLRDLVDAPGELLVAGGRGPEGGPDLVGPAAEKQRGGPHQLVLVPPLVLGVLATERPGVPAVAVLVESGRLHDAVDRQQRGEDQPHTRSVPRPYPSSAPEA